MSLSYLYRDDDRSDPRFDAFRKDFEQQQEDKRVKSEEASRSKAAERLSKQRAWRQQVKRLQSYLQLDSSACLSGLADQDAAGAKGNVAIHPQGDESFVSNSSRYSGATNAAVVTSVVFMSIDIEAFEFNQKLVTEIGISSLDMLDLLRLQLEDEEINWVEQIRARHFRVSEHAHLRNKSHVQGHPDKFGFGKSEWISKRDIRAVVEDCFNLRSPRRRHEPPIVLVGHNLPADVKYLEELGVNLSQFITDSIDTADLFKYLRRKFNGTALGNLLLEYGVAARHLHNAGNDAYYTLRVMIVMAVDDDSKKKTEEDWETEKEKRIEDACKEIRERVCAEMDGWRRVDDNEEEEEDIGTFLSVRFPYGKQLSFDLKSSPSNATTNHAHQARPGECPPQEQKGLVPPLYNETPQAAGATTTHPRPQRSAHDQSSLNYDGSLDKLVLQDGTNSQGGLRETIGPIDTQAKSEQQTHHPRGVAKGGENRGRARYRGAWRGRGPLGGRGRGRIGYSGFHQADRGSASQPEEQTWRW